MVWVKNRGGFIFYPQLGLAQLKVQLQLQLYEQSGGGDL